MTIKPQYIPMELQLFSLPLISTSFIIFFFLFVFFKHEKNSTTIKNIKTLPPGPPKLPIIGNLHQLTGSLPHHSLRNMAKKYGPLMHLKLGQISTIIVSSPEGAKAVMKTHDLIFAYRPQLTSVDILTYNNSNVVFAPYSDYWRQLRKICALELLSEKRVRSFRSIREEEVRDLIESISSSQGVLINVSDKVFASVNNITMRAVIGAKCKDQDELIFLIKESLKLAGGFDVPDLFPSLKFLHSISGAKGKIEKLHRKVDKILDDIIKEHQERRGIIDRKTDITEEDLVDVLLRVQASDGLDFPISANNIKAVILDLFTAGTDTSATTIEWAMSEMIRNPKVMKRAQAEVRNALKGQEKIEEKVDKLKYLNLVVKETLRLHPPTPLLVPRESREKCEINGYQIPKKTKVLINAWAIGRDFENWGRNAELFEPDRFDGSNIGFKGLDFKYIPFGAGRRMCPGILFGIADIKLPLAQLLYHFDWELQKGIQTQDIDMTEEFGASVRRKNDLYLIPDPYIY